MEKSKKEKMTFMSSETKKNAPEVNRITVDDLSSPIFNPTEHTPAKDNETKDTIATYILRFS